jgi:6-phosphogluconate dehydrogenase (decarboxylating)
MNSYLMNAYVNGYTVAKEKKYNVKVPHTKDVWYFKTIEAYLLTISDKKLRSEFTESEIEHYGLQDCDKEEVTDDEEV